MKLALLLFFLIASAQSEEAFCPFETTMVDYTSLVSKNRKIICFKKGFSAVIKHGPEIDFDKDGNRIKEKYFEEGKELAFLETQTGRIHITKVNDKTVDVTQELFY